MENLNIRLAKRVDASMLSDIAVRSKAYWPYEASFIEQCRADLTFNPDQAEDGFTYVAEIDGAVVGFYGFSKTADPPKMTNLFVDPPWIGKGIGYRLWFHAVSFASDQGWDFFEMDADPYAADKFYYKMGCHKIGQTESTVVKGRFLPKLRFDLSH